MISARLEAEQIAGFTEKEADQLFGRLDPDLCAGLTIRLRPPLEVRTEFTARHAHLLRQL